MIQYPPKEFWKHFLEATGAMSAAEAIFMYNACLRVPDEGVWVEMGTHKSKSALVSLMAWVGRNKHEFFLLEPEFTNLDFLNEAQSNVVKFKSEFCGGTGCFFTPEYSTDFLPKFDNYSYIMWDSGSHGDELVQPEKELLQDRMISGGVIVMHDFGSQFTAVIRAYEQLVNSGNYEPINFDWNEINNYCNEHDLESKNNSWHKYEEHKNPNFLGAVRRK